MSILTLQAKELKAARFKAQPFTRLEDDERAQSGRIEIFEAPRPDRMYTLGFDCAHGLDGRDLSAVCVMDKTCQREGDGRSRQVAEAAGWWGEERFDRVVYALHAYYNGAFIMGEAQGGGLAVLRKLWDEYGVQWMYYDKSVGSAAAIPTNNPRLGWNTAADDLPMTNLREVVREHRAEFRSVALLAQMARLKWKPRTRGAEKDERVGDDKLQMKLDGGGSPDLIVAARLAVYALGQVHQFDKPKPSFAPGTYGDIFQLEKRLPEIFKPDRPSGFVSCDRT